MGLQSSAADSHLSVVLLQQARAGEQAALGELLERIRPWLRVLADGRLGSRLAARFDASDVVQQTCLSIYKRIQQFEGQDIAQFMAWVREIHCRNIQDEVRRHLVAQERSVGRDRPLTEIDATVQANESPKSALVLGEDALRLAQALELLPESQRKVIAMRYLEELPVSRIAHLMDLTPDAVTSLVRRGLQQLRMRLKAPD